MGLTTDAILGGFTAVIGGLSAAACVWITFEIAREIFRTGRGPVATEKLRTAEGIALRCLGLAVIFLLRLPMRAMREAGNDALADSWLEWSIYWETPASIALALGLLMIMWPAITSVAPSRTAAIVCVLMFVVGLFLSGVIAIQVASTFLVPA